MALEGPWHQGRNGISELVTAIIIIIIVVAGIIVVIWILFTPLDLPSPSPPSNVVSARIFPQIFDSAANAGVLNEQANFTISIWNETTNSSTVTARVLSGDTPLVVRSVLVNGGQSTSVQASVELNNTGNWEVEASAGGSVLTSYTFVTYGNADEAGLAVGQYQSILYSELISTISLIVSLCAIVLAVKWRREQGN